MGISGNQAEQVVREVKSSPDGRLTEPTRAALVEQVRSEGNVSCDTAREEVSRLEHSAQMLPNEITAFGMMAVPQPVIQPQVVVEPDITVEPQVDVTEEAPSNDGDAAYTEAMRKPGGARWQRQCDRRGFRMETLHYHSIEALRELSVSELHALWELVPTNRQRAYKAAYEREVRTAGAVGSDELERQVAAELLKRYDEAALVPVGIALGALAQQGAGSGETECRAGCAGG